MKTNYKDENTPDKVYIFSATSKFGDNFTK